MCVSGVRLIKSFVSLFSFSFCSYCFVLIVFVIVVSPPTVLLIFIFIVSRLPFYPHGVLQLIKCVEGRPSDALSSSLSLSLASYLAGEPQKTDSSHLWCTSGVRLLICTCTAWCFSNLGGMAHSRYWTSSPGMGTYSPSMLITKGGS